MGLLAFPSPSDLSHRHRAAASQEILGAQPEKLLLFLSQAPPPQHPSALSHRPGNATAHGAVVALTAGLGLALGQPLASPHRWHWLLQCLNGRHLDTYCCRQ